MKVKLIADEATATRIGLSKTATMLHASMKVFAYEQHRTGLTLFAVEIVTHDGKTQIVTTQ